MFGFGLRKCRSSHRRLAAGRIWQPFTDSLVVFVIYLENGKNGGVGKARWVAKRVGGRDCWQV